MSSFLCSKINPSHFDHPYRIVTNEHLRSQHYWAKERWYFANERVRETCPLYSIRSTQHNDNDRFTCVLTMTLTHKILKTICGHASQVPRQEPHTFSWHNLHSSHSCDTLHTSSDMNMLTRAVMTGDWMVRPLSGTVCPAVSPSFSVTVWSLTSLSTLWAMQNTHSLHRRPENTTSLPGQSAWWQANSE